MQNASKNKIPISVKRESGISFSSTFLLWELFLLPEDFEVFFFLEEVPRAEELLEDDEVFDFLTLPLPAIT